MNGPFADEYWKAAEKEIRTLEGVGVWDVVEHKDDRNVVNATGAFKCKQYQNEIVKIFKVCFCAHGDQQMEGIDFLETHSPIV